MSRNSNGDFDTDQPAEPTTDTRPPSSIHRRSFLAATGVLSLGALVPAASSVGAAEPADTLNAKTRTTIWTAAMRENARRNIDRYEWARAERDSAVALADDYLDRYSLDDLWSLVTSQKIPRSGGTRGERSALGGISDPGTTRAWKMISADGYTLPTNDFAAYRESGLDDRGMFDPTLADDSLLVNEEHPEMGEGWGVDDGYGWIDEAGDIMGPGTRLNLVAYYNHWHVWRPGGILRIVRALSRAYLFTGEQRYARAGTVLLDRIADVYPEMTIADYQQPDYWNNHGGRQTGKVIGGGWEPNLVRDILRAYDAFFPGQEGDAELVTFLQSKVEQYPGLSAKDSVEKIRSNIEDGFVRQMLPAAKNSQLVLTRGQLSTVAISARVLDEPDGYTRDALDYIYRPGEEKFVGDVWNEEPENWITTGGNILAPLVDSVDRDGYFNETAPLYNSIRQSSIRQVADVLKGYDAFSGSDLYQHPKFRQTLLQNAHLILLDQHTPELGDTHVQESGNYLNKASITNGFDLTGDDIYAQLWYYLNGDTTTGIRGGIFESEPETVGDQVQEIIDADGPLDLPSVNLAGYGFAALRDGKNYLMRDIGAVQYDFLSVPIVESSVGTKRFEGSGVIQLEAYDAGEHITFEVEVADADSYALEFTYFEATSYGIYDVLVDGEVVGRHDFYSPQSGMHGEFDRFAADVNLSTGTHTITFRNVGKHPDSSNYKFAVGKLRLLDPAAQEALAEVEEKGNAKRAVWLYYGRNSLVAGGTFHSHRDTLNLGVAAHQLEVSPDLGYPEETGHWPKRLNWTANTVSHNTVTVDEETQHSAWSGLPRHFDGGDERVQLVDVEAPEVYPQTDKYRRTTALVNVDDQRSYAVDFFRIVGGDDHVFSFHGWVGDVETTGLSLTQQAGGSYAGETVPFADPTYNETVGSGFNYLDNVARDDNPAAKVSVDWDIEDYWGVRATDADIRLRLTSFGPFDEVALADGHPPQREGNPDHLRYALLRRSGTALKSTFASLIEPYEGERFVQSVEEVPAVPEDETNGTARALKVTLTTGRTDYVVFTTAPQTTHTVDETFDFRGFFGLYSTENSESEYAYVNDGTHLEPLGEKPLINQPTGRVRGFVEEFTKGMKFDNELVVRVADRYQNRIDDISGWAFVDNDGSGGWRGDDDPETPIWGRGKRGLGNGAYEIKGVSERAENLVTLDVGDQTFVRQFEDPDQLEAGGYEYIVEAGDDVLIPLTAVWSRD
ncbi:heparinase II/III family protein [Haladaptatus sp. DYSN1]|uniref:heparinase II/III domain-containing protein n=1 Tax=unclassified Haladaptatus TaxID=2622732 RepID=UPI002404C4EC|nr:heparinase II/III family protein [Haladaptatus sp. DYSN1]